MGLFDSPLTALRKHVPKDDHEWFDEALSRARQPIRHLHGHQHEIAAVRIMSFLILGRRLRGHTYMSDRDAGYVQNAGTLAHRKLDWDTNDRIVTYLNHLKWSGEIPDDAELTAMAERDAAARR